jgi:hypothetical protein
LVSALNLDDIASVLHFSECSVTNCGNSVSYSDNDVNDTLASIFLGITIADPTWRHCFPMQFTYPSCLVIPQTVQQHIALYVISYYSSRREAHAERSTSATNNDFMATAVDAEAY